MNAKERVNGLKANGYMVHPMRYVDGGFWKTIEPCEIEDDETVMEEYCLNEWEVEVYLN